MKIKINAGGVVVLIATIASFLMMPSSYLLAQAVTNTEVKPHVVLRKLFPLEYPPLARQAMTMGDVHLEVFVHPNGSIVSVTPIDGLPILVQAALESAKQSQFECSGCGQADASRSFTYSFHPSTQPSPDPCCCSGNLATVNRTTSQLSQSDDHVTISPFLCVCPDACTLKWAEGHSTFRSAKCLYLWKCGHRPISIL